MLEFFYHHYLFLIIACSLGLLSIVSSMVGSTLFYTHKSQMADALSHAVYPGIILSYMIFQQRVTWLFILGAIVIGYLALILINFLASIPAFSYDSVLALILSSFFGLGMVLMSYIQGNPDYQKVAQAGLQNFIFGQAAFLSMEDLKLIALVSLLVLSLMGILLPKIQTLLFDHVFAVSTNVQVDLIEHLLIIVTLVTISVGLKGVGALLMSSLLITPAIIAKQWTKHYHYSLIIGGLVAFLATLIGTYWSTYYEKIPTGPAIAITLFVFAMASIIITGIYRRIGGHD